VILAHELGTPGGEGHGRRDGNWIYRLRLSGSAWEANRGHPAQGDPRADPGLFGWYIPSQRHFVFRCAPPTEYEADAAPLLQG